LSLAARQISPVEKSTGDVIVYIEGRRPEAVNTLSVIIEGVKK
jgi:hypothetical protein